MPDLHSVAYVCGQLTSISKTGTSPQDIGSTDQCLYIPSLRFGLSFSGCSVNVYRIEEVVNYIDHLALLSAMELICSYCIKK